MRAAWHIYAQPFRDPLMSGLGTGVRAAQVRQTRGWIAHSRKVVRAGDRKDAEQRQQQRDASRADRWLIRRRYRKVTGIKRVQSCGRPGARPDGSVVLRVTDATGTKAQHSMGADGRVAGFGGLFSCGNVHVCASCAPKVAAARAAELERVLAHYIATGGWAVLVTLTLRHHKGHGLDQALDALGDAWTAVNTGGAWQADKQLSDYAGYCRSIEITDGINGWHPHVHAVLVFNSRPSESMIEKMSEGMWQRWCRALGKVGMPLPDREHGLDVQQMDPDAGADRNFETATAWARYVCKGLASEALLGAGKQAKGTNRTIGELLRDAVIPQVWEDADSHELVESVDLTARERLAEYERATKGRKVVSWGGDIRAAAQLDEEQTDEEIAAEDLEGEDVAVLPSESWRVVEPHAAELLAVTERGAAAAARAWLDERGITWWHPTRVTDARRSGAPPGVDA